MSDRLTNNANVLKFIYRTKPYYRKAILQSADKELVHCICECVHNTLQGKIKLKPIEKNKLTKYKNTLRKLIKRGPGETFKKKKQIIIQKGGAFLPLILGPLISGVLGALFTK